MTELTDKIYGWLNEQGYPLEMSVAKALHEQAFSVTQSEYYADPDEGESREIDVVGTKQWEVENILCRISLVIECKTSKDKPWLLFGADNNPLADRARIVQRSSTLAGKVMLSHLLSEPATLALPLFQLEGQHGYGFTQAFTTGSDAAYKAIMAASKAASSIAIETDARPKTSPPLLSLRRFFAFLLFPVVVVTGKLFRCTMDHSTGKLALNEISRGVLVWRNRVVGQPHSIVHIVTDTEFPSFVADANASIIRMKEIIEGGVRDAFIAKVRSVCSRDRTPLISQVSIG